MLDARRRGVGIVYCSNIEAVGDVYSENDGGDAYNTGRRRPQVAGDQSVLR